MQTITTTNFFPDHRQPAIAKQAGMDWLNEVLTIQMAESLIANDADLSSREAVLAILKAEEFSAASIDRLVVAATAEAARQREAA